MQCNMLNLSRRALCLGSFGAMLTLATPVLAAPPANDSFTAQTVLNPALPRIVTGTNVEATKEVGEPNHAGRTGGASVWWRYTVPANGTYTFDTTGSTFDTVLGLYTGATVDALTEVASNDDIGGGINASRVQVVLTSGTLIRIAVDGFGNAQGNIQLSITAPAPGNDDFANATNLAGPLPILTTGNNVSATSETLEPSHVLTTPPRSSVWFTYTVGITGNYAIATTGSNFDTILGVHVGNALGSLTRIASNDDQGGSGGLTSRVTLFLNAGTVIRIAVEGFSGEQGTINLTISGLPPANDNLADTIVIPPGSPVTVTGNNIFATKEVGEPNHAGDAGGASVWWGINLDPGTYVADTNGSDFDTLLAVYLSPTFEVLGQNDDTLNRQSRVEFTLDNPAAVFFAVDGFRSGGAARQGNIRLNLSELPESGGVTTAPISTTFFSPDGWLPLGQSGSLFTADIGSRGYDAGNGALTAFVAPSPRGRIIGWVEDAALDLPYSSIGPGNYVRAKYGVYYSGPGDSASGTLFNQVPNFRLSLRTRGVVTTQLEINHNAQIAGSPAQSTVTRELGPSKDPAKPSVYRVNMNPEDAPHWTNSTTEGVQRGFESLVSGAEFSFVQGVLAVTESSIATYPEPANNVTVVKSFLPGGTPGNSSFDNPTIVLARLGYSASELFRYVAGPSATDYFNPAILNVTVNSEPNLSITTSVGGITVNSAGLGTNRIGVVDAAFNGGIFGDTNATRLRVEPDRLYRLAFRLKQDGASDTAPFIRFGARTVGFGYNATYELLGGRGLPAGDGRIALAQVLPGTGNQLPLTAGDGTFYQLVFSSPMNGGIRADIQGSLDQKFPNLSSEPGPGVDQPSLRNINFSFTVADSLSFASTTATDAAEVASNLNLNAFQIGTYTEVID
jgi:hypothetical protein